MTRSPSKVARALLRLPIKIDKMVARWRRRRAAHRLYAQFMKPGDTCFDVGANVGLRTEMFVALGAKVVAVEPQNPCAAVLREKFGGRPEIEIVEVALGATDGVAEMTVSNVTVLSSMSREWIDEVRKSGRFSHCDWGKTVTVRVTTLDKLIARHGKPVFCKIDVEGFEFEVVKGLSTPIQAASLEFAPEMIQTSIQAIERLAALGMSEFNYSIGESFRLALPKWVGAAEITALLRTLPDKSVFGDVYSRMPQRRGP